MKDVELLPSAAEPTEAAEPTKPPAPPPAERRLDSVDVARGVVVLLSVAVTHIPDSSYTWTRHAQWYGLTFADLLFPMFITLFGAGMALAYRKGVKWRRLWQRTWRLLAIGLLFNGVVAWDLSPSTWRITGVLQLFALAGLVVTLLCFRTRRWWQALLIGVVLLGGYQGLLLGVGAACEDGLPQRGCNPSAAVDPVVFTPEHIYHQGAAGHDPEGLPIIIGASATAIIGFAAGQMLWRWRAGGAAYRLMLLAGALAGTALFANAFVMPFNKRVWSPSFALLAAAATVLLVALAHLLADRLPARSATADKSVHRATWLLVAFGRNSLLVYFGRYVVAVLLAHIGLGALTGGRPIAEALLGWLTPWTPRPALAYMLVAVAGWSLVAAVLHRKQRYIRV